MFFFSVLGIQNISLYDHKGRLKENQDSLLLHIHHYVKVIMSSFKRMTYILYTFIFLNIQQR